MNTKSKTENQTNNKIFPIILELLICLIIISALYLHTLNRPWLFFDENLIFDELYVPIPASLSELFEIIRSFGLVNNLNSVNYLYTSNSIIRTNLFDVPLRMLIGLLLQKNAMYYHLLSLILHLINTSFVFLILRSLSTNSNSPNKLITILLTVIWAIHPVQIESVLLSTNVGALFVYAIFFILFYDFIKNKEKNSNIFRTLVLGSTYLFAMFTNEYIAMLPILFFAYAFIENYRTNNLKTSIKNSLRQTIPYLIGLFLYLIYFLFSNYGSTQPSSYNPFILSLERIFWLSPQIIFHFIKLVFSPLNLSIDQSVFVRLGKSLFDPYAVFCFLTIFIGLLLPIFLFLQKRVAYSLTLASTLFIISLLPYSQIISPNYCLAAERYLYLPLFFIIIGLLKSTSTQTREKLTCTILGLIVIVLFLRSFYRTIDWKDNFTFINSTIKSSPDPLYKGFRTNLLANELLKSNLKNIDEAEKYFYKAIENFKSEKVKYLKVPLILKSYGLDYDSQILKGIYLICFNQLPKTNLDPKVSLDLFKGHLKSLDNGDPRTLELYANLLIKNNEIENAKKIFLFAHKKYPTSSFILVSLIRFNLYIERNLANAKEYLQKALKLYPYSKEILFEALRYYQIENNLTEYSKYAYLYGLRTHSKFTYQEALTGYLTLEQLDNAKKVIDQLFTLDNYDPMTMYLSSSYYIKKKEYKKALELLNQAYSIIKRKPTNQELLFNITNTLASLYLSLGNTQLGFYYAKEALHYAKNNPDNLVKIKLLLKDIGI